MPICGHSSPIGGESQTHKRSHRLPIVVLLAPEWQALAVDEGRAEVNFRVDET